METGRQGVRCQVVRSSGRQVEEVSSEEGGCAKESLCCSEGRKHNQSDERQKELPTPRLLGKEGRSVGVFQPKGSQKDTLFLPRAASGDGPNLPTTFLHPNSTAASSRRQTFSGSRARQTRYDSATSPSYSFLQPVSPRCNHILFQLQGWQFPAR